MIRLMCKRTPNKFAAFSEGLTYPVSSVNHKEGDSAGTIKVKNDKGRLTICTFYLTKRKELIAANCLFRVQLVED